MGEGKCDHKLLQHCGKEQVPRESREGAVSEPLAVNNGFAEAGPMTRRGIVSVITPYYWYSLSV